MLGKLIFATVLACAHAGISRSIFTEPYPDCEVDRHHLLPHEYDCTKFYYCEYGQRWIEPRDCAAGTEFSAELQVCVHPAQANCNLPGFPPEATPAPEPEPKPTVTSVPIGTASPVTKPEPTVTSVPIVTASPVTKPEPTVTSVPIGTASPVTKPEPTVTSVPIVTASPVTKPEPTVTSVPIGTASPVTKPEPTVTSVPIETPTTSAPITDATVTSVPTETTTTSAPVTNATVTSTPTPSTTTEGSPSTPELLPNGCPVDRDVFKLLPSETDCDKFYYCVDGEKVEQQCAQGTYFNDVLQVCDWPENVDCPNSGSATTPAPETDSSEENEGTLPNGCPADFDVHQLLPHESECEKFYYCVHGDKVERECAAGLHFNAELQVCDWPENVDCSNSSSVTTPAPETDSSEENEGTLPNGCPADFDVHQLLPHESECGKFYYCVHGDKVERECAAGLHFNAELQVCDWPENVDCPNSGSATTPAPETDSSEENEGTLPNGCPADFDVHQLLPHESECGKFYYCVHGDKVERECAAGLHFNAELQVCDWPSSAGCNIPEDSVEGSGEPDVIDLLPNGCPVDSNIHQLLPHESECNKFYYCVHGNLVERECSPGLHFNPIIQVCDWPAAAGCSNAGNGDSQESSGAGQDSSENSGEEDSSEGSGGPESGVLPNGCPADFNVYQLLPHESECNKFYYCVHGEKVERQCSAGLHFNPNVQACDWPSAAGCSNSGNGGSSEESGGEDSNESSGNGPQTTPQPEGSGEDSNESSGNGPHTTPQPEGSGVDSNESSGNGPDEATLPNGCPSDPNVHQLLPHESDCGKFYYCVHGDKVERECAAGLHFNATIQVCDWPANAGCSNSGNGGDSQESSGEDSNESSGNGPATTPLPEDSEEEDGGQDKCSQCNILPWAHDTDCDKYWICNGAIPTLITCSEGLHFNAKSLTCDLICNAGCERESVQKTVEKDGLMVFFPWKKVDGELEKIIKKKMI